MTTQTVYCDRCKQVVTADRTELVVGCGPMRLSRESLDLCGPCCADLAQWLGAPALSRPPAGPNGHAPTRDPVRAV